MRYPSLANDNQVAHMPLTLFPSPFPKRLYQECLDIQPTINKLMLKIASDNTFIEESLSSIKSVDEFTRNLLDINHKVQKEGICQPILSCINRADYMLDRFTDDINDLRIRQVEINAIASSMSTPSTFARLMQDFLMSKYRIRCSHSEVLPENNSLKVVAQGLIDAYDAYGKQDVYILFVIEDRSLSFSDHINIELKIHEMRPDIRIVRKRFIDLSRSLKLGPNKELLLDNDKEAAVVYFRYCYDPKHYSFPDAWDTRLKLERSRAIKCPSINFHISGAKKFQQVLNKQEQLEKFLSASEAKKVADVFCDFWSLEASTSLGRDGFEVGLSSRSEKLVLKPQREGGGHNIFGSDIKPFLTALKSVEERSQYILMEYINSPQEKNRILSSDDATQDFKLDFTDRLVSELGIYGSVVADGKLMKVERTGGYLVRSKKFGVKEGGVAAGYAGISGLLLIDDPDKVDWSIYFEK